MQTAIAEPATLVGQLAQLLTQIGIHDSARTPLAHPVARLEISHSFPPHRGRQNFVVRRYFSATLSSIVSASSRLSFAFSLSRYFRRRV
jgi:hypothetical protein